MGQSLRVLIIEDVEQDVKLTLGELRRGGYNPAHLRVETREDLVGALRDGAWDLIISDFSLPPFDARAALVVVQASKIDVPFIIVSGTVGEDVAAEAMRAGAHDYIVKGNLRRLVAAVERELREAVERAARRRSDEELVRSEEARRHAEAGLRSLLHTSPDPIAILREGEMVLVNDALVATFGYASAAQLTGRSVLELIGPEERATFGAQVSARGVAIRERGHGLRRDGVALDLEVVAIPFVFDGADVMLAFFRDVTERNALQLQLMKMDRMVSMGTLAAAVAHEINNPLAYVVANLEFIADETARLRRTAELDARDGGPAAALANIEQIVGETRHGTARVGDIVRNLKTFSRADEETCDVIDILPVLDSSVALAVVEIKHRARLIKLYTGTPRVRANETRLGQVVLNLLINAAHAIVEGNVEQNEVQLTARQEAGWAVIEVSDTGSGIAAEHLEKIFEPFFTTKPLGQGTGLGLAICRQIVRELGGEISVQSALGMGTTFTLRVPSSPDPASDRRIQAAVPANARRGRLLYVDDEPLLGKAMQRLLGRHHDVQVMTRGRDAVDCIERGDRFDAVLCDLMMPDVTGMELHAAITRVAPDQARRMIFLTGGAYAPDARAFLDSVRNPRFEKPVNPNVLLPELRAMVESQSSDRLTARRRASYSPRP